MKNIVVLGSTGSIGKNTLEVARNLKDKFRVVGLSSNSQWELLAEQAEEFNPRYVAVNNCVSVEKLKQRFQGNQLKILTGSDCLQEIVLKQEVDVVVSAVVGAVGLPAAIATIEQGKILALANKESLVMAGHIVMSLAKKDQIVPVDSEHSAIFQSLRSGKRCEVRRVIITASGGPFYDYPADKLRDVKPAQALKHPTWQMGQKITIDSATLMNKALEIIEAKWLFGLTAEQIDVVIHPQSIIHSMVEFCDGSVIAQMGLPDMKVPIQYALTYPERSPLDVQWLDLPKLGSLTFKKPDVEKFPALRLGYQAVRDGGTTGVTLNAANEVAVRAFLNGQIKFTEIAICVEKVINNHRFIKNPCLEEVLAADAWARQEVEKCLI
ncbi:MAG: 1-deoxy-D-xylulose-5-phosphate reductoisomerase [Planctomycetia bacterium]|uniref:1-deoxy-D-xylulose 5-phosphate reductoisomerase n=1 Tax=Candidatus Brocadia sapporoensis TaxID=392547 RepID=A0A1V6M2R6_9BACT|nr:1-deoxy-D-xylulose-5-phosphate reductoisomerase [Candidatus Brocadia sapporoensis]MCC7240005.1 1-deoxy-D-xylulose-5-phosphate reductoisomerase [Candidatus Brocadia sp.]QOJ07710.1 MAG: 1-deoxy-D-xylulose-5-phosphate reductoisomerase [Planctomycetia bacterium]TVL97036.1 MAG: 1-deoxy-D-xylulose-5-phosphate reductoisomerase [Candidatus Brocadia sp. BL1]MDG6005052.1 1-deoxy-D-xylulose-5-phosphate reductoisomerase [Candidatus Brocadia sp.]OQD46698.1 1-deoxy-D-xylulose-5-phosphate reductoisomerase